MMDEYSFNKELNHVYQDIDGIRLVFEDGKLVGWYRPDGWGVKMANDPYAQMVGEMLE